MTSHRRPFSPSLLEPASALEDDDLLHEIFLRLPPQPPYLLRASLVCKRWRCLATDSHFLGRFRLHHQRPPLLGVFSQQGLSVSFTSTLDSPCRIPRDRFSLWLYDPPGSGCSLVECRHGRVLLINRWKRQFMVWDPITNDRSLLAFPSEFYIDTGAVLCAANEKGHVHGSCHSWPFKVVVLGTYLEHADQAVTSVYSSDTVLWGDLISTVLPDRSRGICISGTSTLVGSTLYWLNSAIFGFDTDKQRLAVIEKPFRVKKNDSAQIIQAEDGGLGLAAFRWADYYERGLEIWERNVNPYGVGTWVFRKSVILQEKLGNRMVKPQILNYAEDDHAIFVRVHTYVFMVQLESMQSKELLRSKIDYLGPYYPFTSFYLKVS